MQPIESYETFKMGAQKRVFLPNDNNKCLTSSPDRKKFKAKEVSNSDLCCRAPVEGCPSIEDNAIFIQYQVMSYAIKVHQSQLNENENKNYFPLSSTQQAKSFWKGGNSKTKEVNQQISCNAKPSGLRLAREILKNNHIDNENERSLVVRNILTEQDFDSTSTYERFLTKHSYRKVNFEDNFSQEIQRIDVRRVNQYVRQPSADEIQLYFLPEVRKCFYKLHIVLYLTQTSIPLKFE